MDYIFLCLYMGTSVIISVASDPKLLIVMLAVVMILIGTAFYLINKRD